MGRRPPHAPPRPFLLDEINADTRLVVASLDEKVATKGHGPVDVSVFFVLGRFGSQTRELTAALPNNLACE